MVADENMIGEIHYFRWRMVIFIVVVMKNSLYLIVILKYYHLMWLFYQSNIIVWPFNKFLMTLLEYIIF